MTLRRMGRWEAIFFIVGVALGFGVVLFGRDLVRSWLGVRILDTYPHADETVSAKVRIELEFSQPMKRDTVEDRFHLDPPIDGQFAWEGGILRFLPIRPLLPGVTYTVRLDPEAASLEGLRLRRAQSWRFTVRQPRIVYLSPANGERELWLLPSVSENGGAKQITDSGGRIRDYTVAPGGARLVYAVVNEHGGSDLWLVDDDGSDALILVACETDRCADPAWSPDGVLIAYVREREVGSFDALPGPPHIWLVDVEQGNTWQLYEDENVQGQDPSWASVGLRLAFFDGIAGGIRTLDLKTEVEEVVPTQIGLVGDWSPDGRRMAFNVLYTSEGHPLVEVHVVDFDAKRVDLLLGEMSGWSDFGVPAWSPTGEWIAVSLRIADGASGKQLWLVKPDGSEVHPIADDPRYTYGGYRWDPWGQAIVFQRLSVGIPDAVPDVLLWHMDTGETHVFAKDAALPAWLP
ncbi:MAG: hypothetical protein GTO14_12720 [Anaerolineales bacterium]|nr:hypothetical protein [Anaerolineales bacterium]